MRATGGPTPPRRAEAYAFDALLVLIVRVQNPGVASSSGLAVRRRFPVACGSRGGGEPRPAATTPRWSGAAERPPAQSAECATANCGEGRGPTPPLPCLRRR